MNYKQKATNKRLIAWSEEFLNHHKKCEFRIAFIKECNCNYSLNK